VCIELEFVWAPMIDNDISTMNKIFVFIFSGKHAQKYLKAKIFTP